MASIGTPLPQMAPAAVTSLPQQGSVLMTSSTIEPKDEIEEKLEKADKLLTKVLEENKDSHDLIINHATKNPQQSEELCLGLLYRVLVAGGTQATGPKSTPAYLKAILHLVANRDNLKNVIDKLNFLVMEKYRRLCEGVQVQILYFLREIIKSSIPMADMICFSLLRQIAGGDLSPKNVWLSESLLSIFIDQRTWLFALPVLVQTSLFTYLRLIVDHHSQRLLPLRDREVEFCLEILKGKFDLCMGIGRDLVRLLQSVARIPAFSSLWEDMLHNPTCLCPAFTGGIPQLMKTRTRRLFLQSRLTPDMERKINFLISSVKFGHQRRHQEWFQRSYLASPESQSLRCDLIRYICCVTQQNIQGIPRWAVIGWLLTTCTSNVDASNAKLSLFYDWVFYDPESENVMNIEPAILVMHHSVRTNLSVTATLLDFLCRIMKNFSIPHADAVKQGVLNALKDIVSRRVLPSLSPLFANQSLDAELRQSLADNFPTIASPIPSSTATPTPSTTSTSITLSTTSASLTLSTPAAAAASSIGGKSEQSVEAESRMPQIVIGDNGENSDVAEGVFSDEEEEEAVKDEEVEEELIEEAFAISEAGVEDKNGKKLQLSKVEKGSRGQMSISTIADLETHLEKIKDDKVKELVLKYQRKKIELSQEEASQLMLQVVEESVRFLCCAEESSLESNAKTMSQVFSYLLWSKSLSEEEELKSVFEGGVDETSVQEYTSYPLFILLKSFRDAEEGSKEKHLLLALLAQMKELQPQIGFLLLLLLAGGEVTDGAAIDEQSSLMYSYYADFAVESLRSSRRQQQQQRKSTSGRILAQLKRDLKVCAQEDPRLLCFLLPHIFKHLRRICLGNSTILHLVVSSINAVQLQEIVSRILLGHLTLFPSAKKKSSSDCNGKSGKPEEGLLVKLIKASLDWESIEQIFLWQMLVAHAAISLEALLPLLPSLKFSLHYEALTSFILCLKREVPTSELLRTILNREYLENDSFVISILRNWVQRHQEKLSSLMQMQIHRSSSKKRSSSSSSSTSSSRPAGSSNVSDDPPISLILAHLEHLRRTCTSNLNTFFFRDSMQIALSEMQNFCSETQKLHYSDLLSLAEDFDEDAKFQRNLRQHSRRGGSSATLTPPPSVSPSSVSPSSSSHNFNAISNFEPSKTNAENMNINTAEKRPSSSNNNSNNGSRKHQAKSLSLDDAFQSKICLFCGLVDEKEETSPINVQQKKVPNPCGELLKSERCYAHYRCMQYNSRLWQYDDESMGFGGFNVDFVVDAFHETKNYPCATCLPHKGKPPINNRICPNPRGASAGCAIRACRKAFHFPCAPLYEEIPKRTNSGKLVYHFRTWCSLKHKEADLKKFSKEAAKDEEEDLMKRRERMEVDDDEDEDRSSSDDDRVFRGNNESSDSSDSSDEE